MHHGRMPGAALDCLGLVLAVRAAADLPPIQFTEYPRESLAAHDSAALRLLETYATPAPFIGAGILLVFALASRRVLHFGIATSPTTFVHASGTLGTVVETPLADIWLRWYRSAHYLSGVTYDG